MPVFPFEHIEDSPSMLLVSSDHRHDVLIDESARHGVRSGVAPFWDALISVNRDGVSPLYETPHLPSDRTNAYQKYQNTTRIRRPTGTQKRTTSPYGENIHAAFR